MDLLKEKTNERKTKNDRLPRVFSDLDCDIRYL
jgi:hypothetical protein